MKYYNSIVYLIYFIFIFNITLCNSEDFLESFIIPKDFEEKTLVLNYNDSLTGIITISPVENIFSKYTWLNLYKLKNNNLNSNTCVFNDGICYFYRNFSSKNLKSLIKNYYYNDCKFGFH